MLHHYAADFAAALGNLKELERTLIKAQIADRTQLDADESEKMIEMLGWIEKACAKVGLKTHGRREIERLDTSQFAVPGRARQGQLIW